jgi:S-adenosylmethionine:tRNA ribosyltransferase-isomerase
MISTQATTRQRTENGRSTPLGLDFHLPVELEASAPPESRGLARDQVRLMVSHYLDNRVEHTTFRRLPDILHSGDLLVINTSGTLKAALPAQREDGAAMLLHLSTRLPGGQWVVELREPESGASKQYLFAVAEETLILPGGARATLERPHPGSFGAVLPGRTRLWIASLELPCPWLEYLERHGTPIRYKYVTRPWPAASYQTIYATEPGSAEMPSAGRAFTAGLITRLVARGIQVAPLILHTGVASLEDHEPPYEEYYRVPHSTARLVESTIAAGSRVVAVGTTVVRALESATDEKGRIHPGEGWTELVITPHRRLRAVTAMLTGLHEPRATHLAMLEALAGRDHLQWTYAEALRNEYLWHEFGDMHLLVA